MNWSEHKAIFLQIADAMMDELLSGQALPGERAISVREKAAQLEVNVNTLVRSYGVLVQEGILINKQGLGFFYTEDAPEKARALKKAAFAEELLPQVFRTMDLLGMSPGEFLEAYQAFKAKTSTK